MKCSPLHEEHVALGAKLTPFGGWEMPLHYPSGTLAEHLACRKSAVAFDVSHLGSVEVRGAEAFERLQQTLTNDLGKIAPGRAQYTHLLNDSGGVEDDIIVWWLEDGSFHVMPNASNTDRVIEAVGGEDITSRRAVIAVQGPHAKSLLAEVFAQAATLGRFRITEALWQGERCVLAGTGYTGEEGVEIAVPVAVAGSLWQSIMAAGVQPAGLGARDTLRLEAGLPLHGHELGPEITPLQADLGWVVSWDKGDFIGRAALAIEKEKGVSRLLRGITTQGRRPPREGAIVSLPGSKGELVVIGVVTSGNYAPSLEHGVALAFLDPTVPLGQKVVVTVRGSALEGTVSSTRFLQAH